jgi:excinuclease UvrABC helicase subunit UvrB
VWRHGHRQTFVIANVIQGYKHPTLILWHNKTLAAQLVRELKSYFPTIFVSSSLSPFSPHDVRFEGSCGK